MSNSTSSPYRQCLGGFLMCRGCPHERPHTPSECRTSVRPCWGTTAAQTCLEFQGGQEGVGAKSVDIHNVVRHDGTD